MLLFVISYVMLYKVGDHVTNFIDEETEAQEI